jgi:alkanesulfonate monooxygenase SsuD/methylene tetrahydromethanopterin reductase-like flavin-dependent oxidoreductase (luciferase family)
VVLGIGAGWNEEEYRAYGWPFPPTPVRIAQMSEAIELIRLMWTTSPATYKGEHYQITGAYCEPKPNPIPPVVVGGHGEKYLLRAVAKHADWWNYSFRDDATYAHKQEVLKGHCREVGRDYDGIEQVIRVGILIAETEAEVERLKGQPHIRPMRDIRLAGTPAQVTDALRAIIRRGARRLTVNFADAPLPDGTQLFAQKVLPNL